MIGEDREPRRLQRKERHQLVPGPGMAARVLDGGLVAMVTVGDDDARGRHQRLHARDRVGVGGPPEAVELAPQVARLGHRRAGPRGGLAQRAPGIGGQHEDEPDVGAGRFQQSQAVLLGAGDAHRRVDGGQTKKDSSIEASGTAGVTPPHFEQRARFEQG